MKRIILENGDAVAPPPSINVRVHALFLDIDGTLFPIRDRPEHVVEDTDLTVLLQKLNSRMHGAVAALTGRAIADADRILGGALPCVAGLHGLQVRQDGRISAPAQADAALEAARAEIGARIAAGLDAKIEDKGAALALHYRHAPAHGECVRRAADELAAALGLSAIHGKAVSELMPPGVNKGDALARFLAAPPFAGRVPIAIGDDVTDEFAFSAANARGGVSIRVGEASAQSVARFALPNPEAVRAWLAGAQ